MRLGEDHEEASLVEQITVASGRAADLTKQLLAFSRKGRLQNTNVDLHETVTEVQRLLERSIDPRVRIVRDLQAHHSRVRGDPTQLQNALLNLCVNARDAMPDGGTLTMATRNTMLTADQLDNWPEDLVPGQYLQLEVTDTGVGMDEALQARVFEPFFTTKAEGEGTGLGLAGVYGCVQGHNGAIRIDSAPGRGSTFRLMLPCSNGRVSAGASEQGQGVVSGEGTILVIDDEEIVRRMLDKAISDMGYEVLTAPNGPRGIETFQQAHDRVDAVVLDMVMPRLGGEATFHRLREIEPDVPVLIASGYARNSGVERLTKAGAAGFLPKPFQVDELSRLLARVLGSTADRTAPGE
jgi:CheY-like chemotaxis protein